MNQIAWGHVARASPLDYHSGSIDTSDTVLVFKRVRRRLKGPLSISKAFSCSGVYTLRSLRCNSGVFIKGRISPAYSRLLKFSLQT